MKNGKTIAIAVAVLVVVLLVAFIYVNNAILSWR